MIGPRSTTRSIALTGLPASGKTSVGRHLAKIRGLPFVDLDDRIVAARGITIPEIFAREGEEVFRNLETTALEALALESETSPMVLALGGGSVIRSRNRELLRAFFTTVWLMVDPHIAAVRATGGKRPLLAGGDPAARITKLLAEREAFYAEVADLRIATGAPPAFRIAESIDGQIPRAS